MILTEEELNKIKIILAVYIETLTNQYENANEGKAEIKAEIIACLRILKKII